MSNQKRFRGRGGSGGYWHDGCTEAPEQGRGSAKGPQSAAAGQVPAASAAATDPTHAAKRRKTGAPRASATSLAEREMSLRARLAARTQRQPDEAGAVSGAGTVSGADADVMIEQYVQLQKAAAAAAGAKAGAEWSCARCTLVNSAGDSACHACEAPREVTTDVTILTWNVSELECSRVAAREFTFLDHQV